MKKKPIKCNKCKVKIGELVPNESDPFYKSVFNGKAFFPIGREFLCKKCGEANND